jgi:hypothetical protein
MKTKRTAINRVKAKKQPVSSKKRAKLVFSKHPVLKYLRVIEHKHTGKLVHHRNTSHAVLMIMLVFVGFFLYISTSLANADSNGSVSVGLTVEGPAPTAGAVITSPADGTKLTDQTLVDISGTCLANMFVVVQNNGTLVGSTMCSADGTFNLQIQLQVGDNVLSALNYDNLNQPGPITSSVTIIVKQTKKSQISTGNGKKDVEPVLPTNPSIIPGINSDLSNCDNYKVGNLPTSSEPHVAVVCVPRIFGSKIQQMIGILVWGGLSPYAISINWGNNSDSTLLSLPSPGYKKVTFSYAIPGVYKITIRLKDAANKEAVVQTAVQVTGETKTPIVTVTNDTFGISSWFKTPVPMYIAAVGVTLGFWVGDIFTRRFVTLKHHRRIRKSA